MARKIASKSAAKVCIEIAWTLHCGPAAIISTHTLKAYPADRPLARHCLLPVFIVLILTTFSNLKAESLASKNKEGNRLFAQGKYGDAEKAYLDAQVNSPGRPQVLYNLGNSLIKQNKYDQGIQALRQSISKGDAAVKENSWYNTGNALFSKGDFGDSTDAFIQALRLDPADRDAKHNLELALMKLKQQQEKQSNADQKQQSSGKSNQSQSQADTEGGRQPIKKDQNGSNGPNERNQRVQPQTPPADQQIGSISKERAMQMLDAVQNQELEEQRMLLERRASQRAKGKDW